MSLLIAMFSFSLAMSISPGPINMVIISSSATHGVRKTFSFVSGATIGFTLLLLFIGLGFYKVIDLYPTFFKYLSVVGALYIFYMGYLISRSRPAFNLEKQRQPGFYQGFFLQWLNPKAWMACVSGVSQFSSPSNNQQFMVFLVIYFVVCYLSLFTWSVLGGRAGLVLNNRFRIALFNSLMGGLLILTACFLFYSQIIK
jgi:threonine/homoserine/homoserine lactone efflux protein